MSVIEIIIKSLDPLRAKKTFIRKKLSHIMVSALKASSVTLYIWQKEPEENTVNLQFLITAVVSKTRNLKKPFLNYDTDNPVISSSNCLPKAHASIRTSLMKYVFDIGDIYPQIKSKCAY